MTASDFHGKPVVPNGVVEVLGRHGLNLSGAADELGVASADLRRLLWAQPQLRMPRSRSRSGGSISRRKISTRRLAATSRGDAMQLRCSSFATPPGLAGAVGSRPALALLSCQLALEPRGQLKYVFVGGRTPTISATPSARKPCSCVIRPSLSSTRPAQSVRTGTETRGVTASSKPTGAAIAATMDKAHRFAAAGEKVGGRNKLAKPLGVTGACIGWVLKCEKQ
jgi:hypothetical protein